MMSVIVHGLGSAKTDRAEQFSTIHNYIDTDAMILRKGAVSAKSGEKLIIPINMRDGSIICEGLGNPDWNYSSPHGAGRVMCRKKACATLHMEEYEQSMKGIYSTSVTKDTLDESPMAYKTMTDIINNISPTAKILKIIKPVYNFKASEDKRGGKH
jgi:RNA-splicing ligase RtcB